MVGLGSTRNNADMHILVGQYMEPALRDELLAAAARGETTMTVLACVARFCPEDQREAFKRLNAMGARTAKRYLDNLQRPPTVDAIVDSLAAFLDREFPAANSDVKREALAQVYAALNYERDDA